MGDQFCLEPPGLLIQLWIRDVNVCVCECVSVTTCSLCALSPHSLLSLSFMLDLFTPRT